MTYDIVCNIGIIRCRTSDVQHRTLAIIQMSSDFFWMSEETTCLLARSVRTQWYVPVHTSTYDREILVLPCTWYVPVCTSTDLPRARANPGPVTGKVYRIPDERSKNLKSILARAVQ